MKARILTSILVVVFSVTCLFAANPKNNIYTNTETTEMGSVKEYTFCDKETLKPLKKTVYQYDATGATVQKTTYKWDESFGWAALQKYSYEYNENGKIVNLIYTEWDKGLGTWAKNSDHMLHIYNMNGELLSIRQLHVDDSADYFITLK